MKETLDTAKALGETMQERDAALAENARLREENRKLLNLLNTPETEEFDWAVPLEAAHQQVRWGAAHDAGKNPEDWFWLVGYLAGKALSAIKSGDQPKAKHHCISTAAVLRNWHAHIRSGSSAMRPRIGADKQVLSTPPAEHGAEEGRKARAFDWMDKQRTIQISTVRESECLGTVREIIHGPTGEMHTAKTLLEAIEAVRAEGGGDE